MSVIHMLGPNPVTLRMLARTGVLPRQHTEVLQNPHFGSTENI